MKILSNECAFTLVYYPTDIEYEPATPGGKDEPPTPATAWLKRATVEDAFNDDGEEVQAPEWMLDQANDNAMFENQLIQEKEAWLREWAEERAAYEAEWKADSILMADWRAA